MTAAAYRVYEVQIAGLAHTLLLNEAQARSQGVWVDPPPVGFKVAPTPANKARDVPSKGARSR